MCVCACDRVSGPCGPTYHIASCYITSSTAGVEHCREVKRRNEVFKENNNRRFQLTRPDSEILFPL